jgi:hypothetical protein
MGKSSKNARIYLYDIKNEETIAISKEATSYNVEETRDTEDITVFENQGGKEYAETLSDGTFSFDAIFKRKTKEELENKWEEVSAVVFPLGEGTGKPGWLLEKMFQTSKAITNSISEVIKYSAAFNYGKNETKEVESVIELKLYQSEGGETISGNLSGEILIETGKDYAVEIIDLQQTGDPISFRVIFNEFLSGTGWGSYYVSDQELLKNGRTYIPYDTLMQTAAQNPNANKRLNIEISVPSATTFQARINLYKIK